MRSLLLDVGSGNDLGGQVQPFAEVVETLGGQRVVVVLPRKLGLDIAAGVEGLASLDDEQVLGVDIWMLGKVEVLLSHENALAEEVLCWRVYVSHRLFVALGRKNSPSIRSIDRKYLVDLLAVGLGNQHRDGLVVRSMLKEGSFPDQMDYFCGRKPYKKFEPTCSEVGWLLLYVLWLRARVD